MPSSDGPGRGDGRRRAARLDTCAAIQVHGKWKRRLFDCINREGGVWLAPAVVGSDGRCARGMWICSGGEAN